MKTYTHSDGRVFRLDKTEPYTRKDGTKTALSTWSVACAHAGCQARALVTVPHDCDPSSTKAFGKKHCPSHVLSKDEIKARWLASCTKANTKVTPELLAELIASRKSGMSCALLAVLHPLSESRIRALTSPHVKNRAYTKRV